MVRKLFVLYFLVGGVLLFSMASHSYANKEKTVGAEITSASQSQTPASTIYYGFEELMAGWFPLEKTIKTNLKYFVQDDRIRAQLMITGTTGNVYWNYANSQRFYLEPGRTYRLSGWMFVESLNDPAYPPRLKFEFHRDGKWIVNFLSEKYDMSKNNTWQHLSVVFQAPNVENLMGGVALEKGVKDVALEATVVLSDLTLELLQ